jgi:hypothetical protein
MAMAPRASWGSPTTSRPYGRPAFEKRGNNSFAIGDGTRLSKASLSSTAASSDFRILRRFIKNCSGPR